MKSIGCALVLVLTMSAAIRAQTAPTGPAGTWHTLPGIPPTPDGGPNTIVLKVDGARLTGTVNNGGAEQAIADGKVEGDALSFNVQSPDGARTVTFTGKVNGDEIVFSRQVVVPPGANAGGTGIWGQGGPGTVTVHRVTETDPTAPTGPAGTWQVEQPAGRVVLRLVSGKLFGSVTAPNGNAQQISDGKIEGDTVTFKVQFPNGGRTLTFTGRLSGDEILFTREVSATGTTAGAGLLAGPNGPPEFKAIRLVERDRWSGTVRNAPTPRNQNPNPNPRAVSLATRLTSSPHWRWSGSKSLETRIFSLAANQNFEVTQFDLTADRLSFSYVQGSNERSCQLSRRPGGKFEGRCQDPALLIELTPTSSAEEKSPTPATRN